MKLKKWSVCILATLMLGIGRVHAEVADTNPPEIYGIKIETKEVTQKGTVKVTLDVADDVTGVYTVMLYLAKEEDLYKDLGEQKSIWLNFSNLNDGKNTRTIQLDPSVKPGVYQIQAVYLGDWNGNMVYYRNTPNPLTSDKTWEPLPFAATDTLTITESKEDLNGPILTDFKVEKHEIEVGEKAKITMKATDPDGISSITMNVNNYIFEAKPLGNDLYEIEFYFRTPGEYYIHEIQASDKKQNLSAYTVPGVTNHFANQNYEVLEYEMMHFIVTGESDTVAPKITKVELNQNTFELPSQLRVHLEYEDNIPDDLYTLNVEIVHQTTGKNLKSSCYSPVEDKGMVYTYICDLSQNVDTGAYYIKKISIKDKSFNETVEEYAPTKYTFEIQKTVEATVETSTSSNKVTTVIENAKDNAVIAIDSKRNPIVDKAIFDGIKDTNKTIVIEANGIKWIFQGKDIVNETKSIDTTILFAKVEETEDELNELVEDNPSMMIVFASNGLLPGKALIRIKADYALKEYLGTKIYVYYYDEKEGLLDTVAQEIGVTSQGYYEFYITHNSTFVLTKNKPSNQVVSKKSDESYVMNKDPKKEELFLEEEDMIQVELPTKEETDGIEESKTNTSLELSLAAICGFILVASVYQVYKDTKKEA